MLLMSKECRMCHEFQLEQLYIQNKSKRILPKLIPGFRAICLMLVRSLNWRTSNKNLKIELKALKTVNHYQRRLLWESRILTTKHSHQQHTKTSTRQMPLTALLIPWWKTCKGAWIGLTSYCRGHRLCLVMRREGWLRSLRAAEYQWLASCRRQKGAQSFTATRLIVQLLHLPITHLQRIRRLRPCLQNPQ